MHSKFLLFIITVLFFGCKVPESGIVGKYIDIERDDTLNIKADKTYEFEEKLRNGEHGWNAGNWDISKKNISFTNTTPIPVVGFKLRITKIGESEVPLQLEFVVNEAKKRVQFSDMRVLYKKVGIDNALLIAVSNRILIKTFNFDSIAVKIPYFPFIEFKKEKFDQNGIYRIVIYPAERLYELDKFSYKYRNGALINRSEGIRYRRTN